MKKFLSLLLLSILAAMLSVEAFADESAGIIFNKYSAEEDGVYYVDAVFTGSSKPAMLQFCVAYDSDGLECISVTTGSMFSDNLAPTINQTPGKIYFAWESASSARGGVLLRITFRVKDGMSSASVWIDSSEEFVACDKNYENIATETGSLEIEGQPKEENSEVEIEQVIPPEVIPEDGYSEGIEIDKTQISVGVGEEADLTIGETEKETIWYSSDESVVIVEDGKIISVGPGTATVTVITEDGQEQAACVVTVTEEDIQFSEGELQSSEDENSLVVDSPRGEDEKDEETPAWAWAVILILAAGAGCMVVLAVKKAKKK